MPLSTCFYIRSSIPPLHKFPLKWQAQRTLLSGPQIAVMQTDEAVRDGTVLFQQPLAGACGCSAKVEVVAESRLGDLLLEGERLEKEVV